MEMTPSLRVQWWWRVSRKALGVSLPAIREKPRATVFKRKKGSGSLTYKPNIMEYHEYHGVSSVCDFFILFSKWQRLRSFFIFHGFPTGSSPLDPGMTARSARPAAISQMGHLVSSGWERPPRQEGGAEGSPGSSCRNPAESSQKLPDFEPLETKHGPSPPMEWCLTYLDIRC